MVLKESLRTRTRINVTGSYQVIACASVGERIMVSEKSRVADRTKIDSLYNLHVAVTVVQDREKKEAEKVSIATSRLVL